MQYCSLQLRTCFYHQSHPQLGVVFALAASLHSFCSLPDSSVHGIFQARILEWGCHFLLQEIFPTQGLNLGLPHCRQTLYRLSHQKVLTKVKLCTKVKYKYRKRHHCVYSLIKVHGAAPCLTSRLRNVIPQQFIWCPSAVAPPGGSLPS